MNPLTSVRVDLEHPMSGQTIKDERYTALMALDRAASGSHRTLGSVERTWEQYMALALEAAKQGNHSSQESMLLGALTHTKSFEQTDPRLPHTLDRIASFYYKTGRMSQALQMCQRLLEIAEKLYGYRSVKVAACLNNLAGIYYNENRYQEAEEASIKALDIYTHFYGNDHEEVGMVANNLAMSYHARKDYANAARWYKRAWSIRERHLGPTSPQVLALLENYADVLFASNRIREAEQIRDWARVSGNWPSS